VEMMLEIKNLRTSFETNKGKVRAVDGVNLSLKKGEILGIVGESGSGKSITSLSVMRLLEENGMIEGEIHLDGKSVLEQTEEEMRRIRGNTVSMIFQDPMTSLNPVYTIGDQIAEAVMMHGKGISKKTAWNRAVEMLTLVGIPSAEYRAYDYPHKFSGGMRQRAMIAMALACEPKLLIADEPTTALDVTIQAQILNLLVSLQRKFGMSILLITHDLGVVAETCDRVVVMYAGQIVEEASVEELFRNPQHPYTKGLLESIPKLGSKTRLKPIDGQPPVLYEIKEGCRFASRCPWVEEACLREEPPMEERNPNHKVRCIRKEVI
jgi:oligopeptide/dipeptide ABC transporter ATP-binding protein